MRDRVIWWKTLDGHYREALDSAAEARFGHPDPQGNPLDGLYVFPDGVFVLQVSHYDGFDVYDSGREVSADEALSLCRGWGIDEDRWPPSLRRMARERHLFSAGMAASARPEAPPVDSPRPPRAKKEAAALGLLAAHPLWTCKQIAAAVPCNPKSLSRMRLFRAAREELKGGRDELPRGHLGEDGRLRDAHG